MFAEWMDQPELDDGEHRRALRALARVNVVSGVVASFWKAIRPLAHNRTERPLRILDMACGGGDVAIGLRCRAARAGLAVEVEGCDLTAVAVKHATERARASGVDVRFFRRDLLSEALPSGYDVLCNSLFLHHLELAEAERLLRDIARSDARLVLLSDLVRSRLGYQMAFWGPRLLSRSAVAHNDGPLSVRAAFTLEEVRELMARVGIEGAELRAVWPQRFLLRWNGR